MCTKALVQRTESFGSVDRGLGAALLVKKMHWALDRLCNATYTWTREVGVRKDKDLGGCRRFGRAE